ncbi:glycoside hydrolase [Mycobacterium sp.]|uniref:glycoside hydrolase n=1 Tax=Mycobacterium sp. TaxID=1785 RepID=UPI0025D46BC9|nr:glycoside hydrolase [Mycobacterium sp.]
MTGNRSTNGLGRWLAFGATLIVSAGMFYAQSTESRCCTTKPTVAASNASPVAHPQPVPSPPPHPAPLRVASPAELKSLTADAPAAAQSFTFALPTGVAPESGLQVKTIWAARAISLLFPQITTIGGYRQDALRWHPNGLAIDVMIPNHNSPEGIELGDQIAGYALANAKRWGVDHVIWRQKIYPGLGNPSWTANLGNETANHYDHVHIATDGGGYPTGHETYSIGSMTPTPPA